MRKSEIRAQAQAALEHLREASSAKTEADADHHIAEGLALLGRAAGLPLRERDFSAAQRKKGADSGAAMSDGKYPIWNQADADNAWDLRGKSKNHSEADVVAHIRKRVKALGLKMPGGDQARESAPPRTLRERVALGELSPLEAMDPDTREDLRVPLLERMDIDPDELKAC